MFSDFTDILWAFYGGFISDINVHTVFYPSQWSEQKFVLDVTVQELLYKINIFSTAWVIGTVH